MIRRLLAFLLLLMAWPAFATPGQWDAGSQPVVYPIIGPSGNFTEFLGDGTTHGGLPPFFALQPADIPSTSISSQIVEGTGVGTSTGTDEGKFRFTLFGSHVLPDDMLRAFCVRGGSHIHEFMGSKKIGACSTFTQLRTDAVADHNAGRAATTNPGDDLNASTYWHAALFDRNPLGDGKDRIKKVYAVPLYYQIQAQLCGTNNACLLTRAATNIDLPLDLGYISGQNMSDPSNSRVINAIAAANAANVAAGGPSNAYQYIGNGFVGWSCVAPGGALRSGQFDNTEDLDCLAGDTLIEEIHGAGCVDGKNLHSPSGYDHVMPFIRAVATNGNFDDVCPKNWFKIPQLIDKSQWILLKGISSSVANDAPYLDSDAAFQTAMRLVPGQSAFVCKSGCSAHFDYEVAWMKKYLRRAFRKCLGIPQTDTSETGLDADQTVNLMACNANTLSPDSYLTTTNQVTFPDVNGDRLQEYYPTPATRGQMGPATMPNN